MSQFPTFRRYWRYVKRASVGVGPMWLSVLASLITLPLAMMKLVPVKRVREKEFLSLCRIAAERGIPLHEVLDGSLDELDVWNQYRVEEVAADLHQGTPLSAALVGTGLVSPQTMVFIQMGEENNCLPRALELAENALDQPSRTRMDIRKEVTYWFLLLLVLTQIVGFVLIFIMPKYKEIFEGFDMELPQVSLTVIRTGDVLATYSLFLVPLFILAVLTVLSLCSPRTEHLRLAQMAKDFFLPLRVWKVSVMRLLSLGFNEGKPIEPLVDQLALIHPQRKVRKALTQVGEGISQGSDLWEAIRSTKMLSENDAVMFASAQRAGNLPWMIQHFAVCQENRWNYQVRTALTWARPTVLLMFGVVVGVIALAFISPLYVMINGLS